MPRRSLVNTIGRRARWRWHGWVLSRDVQLRLDCSVSIGPASATPDQAPPPTPPCVVCGRAGSRPWAPHHLTHGVTVWLCATHRSDGFLRRRGGRDFAERLGAAWAAAGATGARRAAALRAHVRRQQRPAPTRVRPGSYSWPRLRAEAERRFAAGEPPRRVIAELRRRHARGVATAPSVRTMRRWFTDARWLLTSGPATPAVRRRRTKKSVRRRPAAPLLPPGLNTRPFFPTTNGGSTGAAGGESELPLAQRGLQARRGQPG